MRRSFFWHRSDATKTVPGLNDGICIAGTESSEKWWRRRLRLRRLAEAEKEEEVEKEEEEATRRTAAATRTDLSRRR